MTSFDKCKSIEERGLEELEIFFRYSMPGGEFTILRKDKGGVVTLLQKLGIDVLFNHPDKTTLTGDFKIELENKYGNFFLETWSNKSRGRKGWLHTSECDLILYYFMDTQKLYPIPTKTLRGWLVGKRYPEKEQAKYDQKNDTWGLCVPIVDVESQLKIRPRDVAKCLAGMVKDKFEATTLQELV